MTNLTRRNFFKSFAGIGAGVAATILLPKMEIGKPEDGEITFPLDGTTWEQGKPFFPGEEIPSVTYATGGKYVAIWDGGAWSKLEVKDLPLKDIGGTINGNLYISGDFIVPPPTEEIEFLVRYDRQTS